MINSSSRAAWESKFTINSKLEVAKDESSELADDIQKSRLGRNQSELKTSIVQPTDRQKMFVQNGEVDIEDLINEKAKREAIFLDKFHGKENLRLKMAKQAQLLKDKKTKLYLK